MESVTEPVFISKSVSLKLQVFTMNDSDEVCKGARFYLHAVLVCF